MGSGKNENNQKISILVTPVCTANLNTLIDHSTPQSSRPPTGL
jgi:hypothetical protein